MLILDRSEAKGTHQYNEEELEKQLEEFKNKQDNLPEKVNRNSNNSNSLPSTDSIKLTD